MERFWIWIWHWDEAADRAIDAGLEAVVVTALVALALLVIGGQSRAAPHCRRCGADLRRLLLDGSAVCACGADARRRGAVRWRGRSRSMRWIVAVAAMLLFATAMRAWSLATGHRWRDFRSESSLLAVIEAATDSIDERTYAIAARELARRIEDGQHSSGSMRRAFIAIAQEERKPLATAATPLLDAIRHHADDTLFAEIVDRVTRSASGTITRDRVEVDGTSVDLIAANVDPMEPWWSEARWDLVGVHRVTLGTEILWDSSLEEAPDPRLAFGGRLVESPGAILVGLPAREPLLTVNGLAPGAVDLTVEFAFRLVDRRIAKALAAAGRTIAEFDARESTSHRAERRLVQPLLVRPGRDAPPVETVANTEAEP